MARRQRERLFVSSARQAAVSPAKEASAAKAAAPKGRRKSAIAAVAGGESPDAEVVADAAAPAAGAPAAGLPTIDPEAEPPAAELVDEEEEDEDDVVVVEEDNSGPSTDLVRAYLKEIGRVALLNAE